MKVLLVEDNPSLQTAIRRMLFSLFGKDTYVLIAGNLHDARNTFFEHSNSLDLILMDLSLGRGEFTFDLIKEISRVYPGKMIAISTNIDRHQEMLNFGCTHACGKMDLFEFLEQRKFEKPHV